MAAAASTAAAAVMSSKLSTNPSSESYIGSLISLTSKSDIRYEGVLFSINTQESTIALRNVRSFGTEGRKQDGPQVAGDDRIYEYILFRGSDIKDLQVKAPPVAHITPIHSDPAIIQTHNPQLAAPSANPPFASSGTIPDVGSHMPYLGAQRPAFQGSLPMYQTGGSLGSWGLSAPPPSANNSGLAVPLYWQGYYPPVAALPHLQPLDLLNPPPGLQNPPSTHQSLQYPGLTTSLPNFSSPMLPTTSSLGSASTTFPSTSQRLPSSLPLESPQVTTGNRTTATSLPVPNTSTNVPIGPLLPTVAESMATLSASMPSVGSSNRILPNPNMVSKSSYQPVSSVEGSSRTSEIENTVPLLTPDDLIPRGPSALASSYLQSSNKDVHQPPDGRSKPSSQKDAVVKSQEAKPESSVPLSPASSHATVGSNEPILPLPKPIVQKVGFRPNGVGLHAYRTNRGRGRGRINGNQHHVTKFTEDFDFMAMNEKFNKDEVWGHLGQSKALLGDMEGELNEDADGDGPDEDGDGHKLQQKPVYVKDDFFDSLSCNALDRESNSERPKFSEQLKIDTETFGNFSRHRTNRGGGYAYRGGQGRGSYYGRGHSFGGRGRGRTSAPRAQSREI